MFTWLFKENYLKEKSDQPFSDNQKENVNTLFLHFLQLKRKTQRLTWTRSFHCTKNGEKHSVRVMLLQVYKEIT